MGYLEDLAAANCVECGVKGTVGSDRCEPCYMAYQEARFNPNMSPGDLAKMWGTTINL